MTDTRVLSVDVKDLRVGYYVQINEGWLLHPFVMNAFLIESTEQIKKFVASGIQYVDVVPGKSIVEVVGISESVDSKPIVQLERSESIRESIPEEYIQPETVQDIIDRCEQKVSQFREQYDSSFAMAISNPRKVFYDAKKSIFDSVETLLNADKVVIRLVTESSNSTASMHSVNVMMLSMLLGKELGYDKTELIDISLVGFFHDIGKVKLPVAIRNQRPDFSRAELRLYQSHVQFGHEIGVNMGLSDKMLNALAKHHQFIDGSGYPSPVNIGQFDTFARIISIIDSYDSYCNCVSASTSMTPHEALSLMYTKLSNKYDKHILGKFIRMMGVYPPGSIVQMTDSRYAIVVGVNSDNPLRPYIVFYSDEVPYHDSIVTNMNANDECIIRRSICLSKLPTEVVEKFGASRISIYFDPIKNAAAVQ